MSKSSNSSRSKFIKDVTLAGAAFTIVPRFDLGGNGYVPPSELVHIACIGVCCEGTSELTGVAKNSNARVVFLCDVDDRMAVESKKNFPKAKYYKDFRTMLDKENSGIDAVTVST